MSITKLTVTIGEQEVAMTIVEAQRLYNDLHVLFGKPAYPQFQPPQPPTYPPGVRGPISWGDTSGKMYPAWKDAIPLLNESEPA